MNNTDKAYYGGWSDGFTAAVRIVENAETLEDVRKAIKDEMRFRELSGGISPIGHKELDRITDHMKRLTIQTLRITLVASVADSYGFGKKRIMRCLDNFNKLTCYLSNGWLTWLDLIEEIKKRFDWDLDIDEDSDMLAHYTRPAPEDMYTEADFISETNWQNLLELIGFTEKKEGDKMHVFDGNTGVLYYSGPYQKIQAYDVVTGMLIEREHQAEQKGAAGQPKAETPVKPEVKRRKKRKHR